MFARKPERNLSEIWKLFNFSKTLLGHAEIESRYYKTYSKVVYPAFMASQVINSALLGWATLASKDLDFKVQQGMNTVMFSPALILFSLTYFNLEKCGKTLLWCENLHERFRYESFERAKKRSTGVFKAIYYGLLGSTVAALVVQSVALSLVTGSLVSAYGTPPPFGTVLERVVICLIQCFDSVFLVISNCVAFGTTCAMIFYGIACLEYMRELCSSLSPKMPSQEFNRSIQDIVELHCDFWKFSDLFRSFSSYYLGIFEGCLYLALLLVWITVFFMNELAFSACGILVNVSPSFLSSILNEKLADSYGSFKDALYDTQWYEMEPRRRKDIRFVMVVAEQRKLLQCGPLHVLSYEELTVLLKRVYSYGLSLNKLLRA